MFIIGFEESNLFQISSKWVIPTCLTHLKYKLEWWTCMVKKFGMTLESLRSCYKKITSHGHLIGYPKNYVQYQKHNTIMLCFNFKKIVGISRNLWFLM